MKQRVLVAMSGGVDSSVAAALLVRAGYDVVGVAMRLWKGPSDSGCCSLDDFLDARRVAARLSIPFYVMDFSDLFESQVVRPFAEEYLRGRTPNPCARCNQFVKFDALLERARSLGAQLVATGHYARLVRSPDSSEVSLHAAHSVEKDQSYFLFGIQRETLPYLLFPVGDKHKEEVRALARSLQLPVAEKPESQEVCFVPRRDYASFVESYLGTGGIAGDIVHENGTVLGRHRGIHRFTIGQRRGLGVSNGAPLYVTGLDPVRGLVQVGNRSATVAKGLRATAVNWLVPQPPRAGQRLTVKIRSRFRNAPVVVEETSSAHFVVSAPNGLQAVTPGQAAVLYDGDQVVGGGWIDAAL
ncbi:MAG: tRNA 2-thiouridine(34) synthase MnmA [Candidatus Binatia bacterium]|nr:tRNA 2-thiouridine(34) synthase MnmA [Candidatus Binatia bacterium]